MTLLGTPRGARLDYSSLALALLLVAMAARLSTMWSAAARGMDFTDEGYYLVWISEPFRYLASATQFGFAYHPLWQWLDGDLVALRRANIALTWLLSVFFGWCFFRVAWPGAQGDGRAVRTPALALACTLGVAYPNAFNAWLPTPSYNSLALQGLLLALSGMLLMAHTDARTPVTGAVLLGTGGWLAYLGKPTTAAALALLVPAYLLVSRRWHWRHVLVAGVVALLLLVATAFAIDGSPGAFLQRQSEAIRIAGLMGIQPSLGRLMRIDSFRFSGLDLGLFVLLALVTAVTTVAAVRAPRRLDMCWLFLALLVTVVTFMVAEQRWPLATASRPFRGNLMLAIPAGTLLATIELLRRTRSRQVDMSAWALCGLLLLTPHAFAFGTGSNYWKSASTAQIFWVYAGVAMLAAVRGWTGDWRVLLPLSLGVQGLGLVLLTMALAHPYRQVPLTLASDTRYALRGGSARLELRQAEADYLDALARAASQSGFRPGDPMIDLSGQSPGTLFALGAQVVGQPWLLGGYPGSERAARAVLAAEPCETLAVAWILLQPEGPRALTASVLDARAFDLQRDFTEIARVLTPPGFGGYPAPGTQLLLKPTRSSPNALAACRGARQ